MSLLPKIIPPLKDISLYETKSAYFLVGLNEMNNTYSILEISRHVFGLESNNKLKIKQHPGEYTLTQINQRKQQMKATYKDMECLYEHLYGIWGFVKLLVSYYMIVITDAEIVGDLAGHSIYGVKNTSLVTITFKPKSSSDEIKYKALLSTADLAKNMYFSYTYDLSKSWQQNIAGKRNNAEKTLDCQHMFVWNCYALKPLLAVSSDNQSQEYSTSWILPIVYGFIRQKTFKLQDSAHLVCILIARRSRHFAGTRYLRRGVDCTGMVANEVESEQIFTKYTLTPGDFPRTSSFVQCRGSIPLYWSHINLYNLSPDVKLELDGDEWRNAFKIHFENLYMRYGPYISALNLVRQFGRELEIGEKYTEVCNNLIELYSLPVSYSTLSISYLSDLLNFTLPQHPNIAYTAYDFLANAKKFSESAVFDYLEQFSERIFPDIGFYVDPPNWMDSKHWYTTNPCLIQSTASSSMRERNIHEEIKMVLSQISNETDATMSQGSQSAGVGMGVSIGLLQTGVLRTNCMDCLDRTNVAQFCCARIVIPRQLKALGLILSPNGLQDVTSQCMEMWAEHGDAIANQYGGSGAMHKVDEEKKNSEEHGERVFVLTGGAKNAFVAAQRYYSNVSLDFERQQQIDLILGIFVPNKDEPTIWDLNLRPENIRSGERGRRASDMSPTLHDSLRDRTFTSEFFKNMEVYDSDEEIDGQNPLVEDASSAAINEIQYECSQHENGIVNGNNTLYEFVRPYFKIDNVHCKYYHQDAMNVVSLTNMSDVMAKRFFSVINLDRVAVFPFPYDRINSVQPLALSSKMLQAKGEDANCSIRQLYSDYINNDFCFFSNDPFAQNIFLKSTGSKAQLPLKESDCRHNESKSTEEKTLKSLSISNPQHAPAYPAKMNRSLAGKCPHEDVGALQNDITATPYSSRYSDENGSSQENAQQKQDIIAVSRRDTFVDNRNSEDRIQIEQNSNQSKGFLRNFWPFNSKSTKDNRSQQGQSLPTDKNGKDEQILYERIEQHKQPFSALTKDASNRPKQPLPADAVKNNSNLRSQVESIVDQILIERLKTCDDELRDLVRAALFNNNNLENL